MYNLTLTYIHIAYSLIDLAGVNSFLSERLSQDPLEKYFGQQRQRGGVNENPACDEFLPSTESSKLH